VTRCRGEEGELVEVPPSLGIPDKSDNISQIYLGYILGNILDISKIYLGYRCIREMNPKYIPDLSNIPDLSRIYHRFI
jgi:hypothetical protein